MRPIARMAMVYLIAVLFFGWGAAVGRYEVFPFAYVSSVKDDITEFVRGNVDENTSLTQKIANDLGISPERMIREYEAADSERFREVSLDGIRERRDPPRMWMSPSAPQQYRLIVGAFDFEKAFWGAILLDPAGHVVHRWYMNGEIEELNGKPDTLKNLYGVAFFPDGSAVFTMHELLGGIVRIDFCSRVQWIKKGVYHHVAQPTEDYSAFWTFGGRQDDLHPVLILIDAGTGETIKEIDMADVQKANPETFILDLSSRPGVEHEDATHPNHIEPLPKALADAYPGFSAGDLVLSYHTTNLIFVIDPESLKIKWWYVGAGDGQHDPDWHRDGTISIVNNNYRAEHLGIPAFSSIVSIDPATNSHRTVIDGAPFNFYSKINGHHHFTDDGTVIITSSTQGRVFEVELATGEKVFDYVNAYEWDNGRTLHLSETFILDKETAERWLSTDCSATNLAKGT